MTNPASSRQRIAEAIRNWIVEQGLANHMNSPVEREQFGQFYSLGFGKEGVLEGGIRVYAEDYIAVAWHTTLPGMPRAGLKVYDTPDNALTFLQLAFKQDKPQTALQVPTRRPTGIRKTASGPNTAEIAKAIEQGDGNPIDFSKYL